MPQWEAGCLMEPPVSEPRAAQAILAATAAPEPPLDPPGMRSSDQGFLVGKNAEFSVEDPMANSSMLSFPKNTAPSSFSRATTVASYGGTKCSRILEAQVVGMPSVQRTSFRPMGMPVRGRWSPEAILLSASSAAFSAWSAVTVMYAFTLGSTASIRSR